MALEPQIEIDPGLTGKVLLAPVFAEGLEVGSGEALWSVFKPFCAELYRRYHGTSMGEVPGVQTARQLYRAIGVDPTRVRPSSEALLRRVLKGRELYRINSLVDTINYLSLSFLLPIGLYDLDRLEGEAVILRRGQAGESFEGIRKDLVNLEGRYALFDDRGPFGSPTSDSERTCIGSSTRRALTVIFAPSHTGAGELEEHSRFAAGRIAQFGGGQPETHPGQIIG